MMMDFQRLLDLPTLLEKKSYFLFGPRTTGKTTLIHQQISKDYQYINLLDSDIYLRLLARPALLRELLDPQKKGVVIDEIQKIPALLDEVHLLIEAQKITFLLTGSSARALKRKGVNLLAGRARTAHLYPLVAKEIAQFNLDKMLSFGGLPSIYLSDAPFVDLKAYVDTYLKEEIQEEAHVRNLSGFVRFLKTAALQNAQLLNFAAVSSDSMVKESTVRSHYQILQDTLIGSLLEPWRLSQKRKAIQTAKFYFFDTGVCHALLDVQTLPRSSDLYGRAFEHWVYRELQAYLSYKERLLPLTFWRSVNGQEVDFLVGDQVAIEAKATQRVSDRDLHGLRALAEENVFKKFLLVSQDPIRQEKAGVLCLHYSEFIDLLWSGNLF